MEQLVRQAFDKLQKREHLLRVARDLRATGRITQEEFRGREAEILGKYSLTIQEQRAYDLYLRVTQQKRRRK